MSISNFQEKFLNGGCAKFLLGFMAVVFVGGLAYTGFGGGGGSKGANEAKSAPALSVGTVEIPASDVENAVQGMVRQQLAGYPNPTPDLLAAVSAGALDSMVNNAAIMYLARQDGVDFNDNAAIKAALLSSLDEQIEMAKIQFQFQPQNKGKTDKDFEAEIKKQTGQTIPELKANAAKNIDESLKDPQKREGLIQQASQKLLLDKYKKDAAVSDETVKAGYTTFVVKKIVLKGEDQAKAGQILDDIRAGKTTFEQAIDKFSKDAVPAKGKLSDQTEPLTGAQVQGMPELKPLLALKAGQISSPLKVADDLSIYKVISVKENLPADFATNKKKYLDQAAQAAASQKLQEELKKVQESGLVKWKSPGYEALYTYGKSLSAGMSDPKEREAKLRAVVEQARKAVNDGADGRLAALAEYAAFKAIYEAPGADKAKLRDERIQVLNDVLTSIESSALRLELVDLYIESKKGTEAIGELMQAAANNSDFDQSGETVYRDIEGRIAKMKATGLLSADQEKELRNEQNRWKADKAQSDKDRAEAKAQEEADRKKAEAEEKAERAKAAQEEKKSAPTTAPKGP